MVRKADAPRAAVQPSGRVGRGENHSHGSVYISSRCHVGLCVNTAYGAGERRVKPERLRKMSEYLKTCPSYLQRRNGRLMRRGYLKKERLTYVRTSRRPIFVRGIINELPESQQRANEWMNLMIEYIHAGLCPKTDFWGRIGGGLRVNR